jgi:hypothetical protein
MWQVGAVVAVAAFVGCWHLNISALLILLHSHFPFSERNISLCCVYACGLALACAYENELQL